MIATGHRGKNLLEYENGLAKPIDVTQEEKMMSLDAAVEYIRQTDETVWNRLIAEMNCTRRHRDEEAARKFAAGDRAAFDSENPPRSVSGQVVKVGRTRLIIAAQSQVTGLLERISVPASLVRKVE